MEKKTNFQTIMIVLLVIGLLFCFYKIDNLEAKIGSLENSMNNQYHSLMTNVENIYDNVDEKLEQQASLLSGVEYEYGELNTDWHTVDIKISVVPKVITDDMSICVRCGAAEAELTRYENEYIGLIPVDLFNEEEKILLTITTADGQQTEYLQNIYIDCLWTGYLPSLYYCDISGSATFTEGKYTLNAALDINCSPVEDTPDVTFTNFVLVTELNGAEIGREDISEDVLNYEAYPHGVYFRDEYKKEYEASEGDELAIYLEATDSMGYVHQRLVHYWKEQNGASAETVDGGEMIYDSEGNLLYGKS